MALPCSALLLLTFTAQALFVSPQEGTMNKSTLKLIFLAALVAAPTSVFAEVILQTRCTLDSLDIPGAKARVEWARRCGLTLNTGSVPNTGDPTNFFVSTLAADLATGPDFQGAKDYRENNPSRAFSG